MAQLILIWAKFRLKSLEYCQEKLPRFMSDKYV